MQPRPESRVESLEKRTTTIEAVLLELASDQAEELKAIQQDIKKLDDSVTASYKTIGDTFVEFGKTMATKDDISKLEARFDKVEEDITALKTDHGAKLDTILQLLQQKSGE